MSQSIAIRSGALRLVPISISFTGTRQPLHRSSRRLTAAVPIAFFALLVALFLTPGRLAAQSSTWTQTTSGGLWTTSGNWLSVIPANGSTSTADFSTLLLSSNNTVHLDAPETIGSLLFGDRGYAFNWTLDNNGSSSNVLTLAGSASVTDLNDSVTISAVLAGNSGLTVNSLPLVTIQNGQVYNLGGPTNFPANSSNVATPGTLILNPSAVESYTGTTTLVSGILALDFSNLATPTNMISSGSALVLANGALAVRDQSGANATLQSFAGTTFSGGAASISVSVNGNTNNGSKLALGALTRSNGGTVDFTLPTTLNLTAPVVGSITTPTGNGFGTGSAAILGGYAVVTTNNNVTYATSAGDGTNPGAISGLAQSGYTANAFGANVNTAITGAQSLTSSPLSNSLYFNVASATLTSTAAQTLTIGSGGILASPNVGPTTFGINLGTNPPLTLATSNAQNDIVVNQYDPNGIMVMTGNLTNNGATPVGLTKTGPGTLVTFSGTIAEFGSGTYFLNQGVVASWTAFTGTGSQVTFTGNSTYQVFTAAGGSPRSPSFVRAT